MSAAVVTEQTSAVSPRTRARITGVVYLLYFLTAVLGAVVAPKIGGPGGLSGDAAATAHTILAHDALVRLGWALGLISTVLYVALIALFYRLLRVAGRGPALLAAFFGLTGCTVTAVGSVFQLGALVILGNSPYLGVFDTRQVQALALLALNLGAQARTTALVFSGPFQLALGYLIYRSGFLPRILGVLIALAGVGWLTFLWPPLASALLTPIEVVGFVAEAALMLWLLVMGVNAQRWQD
jgi:hypothetical protein